MAAPYPQVVLLGDSLFQDSTNVQDGFCFQGALQQRFVREYDVVNRGFSGYNTSQMLRILPQVIQPPEKGPKIAYLFILLGANDAALPLKKDDQHVSLEQYAQNLRAILDHPYVRAHRDARLFVVTPPPVDEINIAERDRAEGRDFAVRQSAISASYSATARRVATEATGDVTVVDLFSALLAHAVAHTPGFDPATAAGQLGSPAAGVRGHLEHLLPDGLHMNGEAYKVFFDEVIKAMGLPDRDSDNFSNGWVYPEWRHAPWL